jgi:hypothetical protein
VDASCLRRPRKIKQISAFEFDAEDPDVVTQTNPLELSGLRSNL